MNRSLRLAGSVLLIALFIWAVGRAEVIERLQSVAPVWIAVAVACLLTQTLAMALRWRLVARCLGMEFSAGWAVREYFLSQLANTTLPGGVIGDGARAVRSRIGQNGLRRAGQAVIFERALGQAGMLAVALAGLISVLLVPGAIAWPVGRWSALAIAVVVALVIAAFALRGSRIAGFVAQCLPTARVRLAHAALSVGAALLNVAAFAACARATGVELPLGAALLLIPMILLAMVIPLTVAGWGWREGAAAALFPIAGASPAAGVAAGIAFGLAMLISVLPALALLLTSPGSGVRDIELADRR
ncbi:lysylphosphatidylglycerol synthase transmembrane domain-containing protein [Tropicimonas sp. IMCC34011]|uniref:lysylphosphatidylglycerol synthase transmembrane domain-containing protein n=1 Tax=Tropicimonas sp. IMCC34011 TaxID=2248759 RepID=UPI000E2779FA|nr:lysylphosphatidylglycerol synthase transmembrane domain-containing protein [Tropicimonas sp. IMCC34011]